MGRAVRQFEKEVSFSLWTGVGYVTSNCMELLHVTVWDAPFASSKKKLVLDQQQEKYFLTDTLKKACNRLALQKMVTAFSVESRAQNQSFVSNLGLGLKPVQNYKSIFVRIEKVWLSAQNT